MSSTLHDPYAVTADHITRFRKNGFVKLKNVLTPDILGEYGREITRLTIDLNTQAVPLHERSTYNRAFLQVMNLWRQSAVIEQFIISRRLGRIAAELLQVAGVRLYHDQSLYKEPGGGYTPAHADQYYWPLATDRTATAWIPLQPVPMEMGPLAFFAGSQSVEFGRDLEISEESERAITAHMERSGFSLVDEPFDLGEVSFHLGWTFHRAGGNLTDRPRSVMTIIYMDDAMRLKEPSNRKQRNDWSRWCPGAIPGEIIETPLNPLIYHSTKNA